MADKFSLEDILNEYSGKTLNPNKNLDVGNSSYNHNSSTSEDIDSILNTPISKKTPSETSIDDAILNMENDIRSKSHTMLSKDKDNIVEPKNYNAAKRVSQDTIGLQIQSGVKPSQNIQPIISEEKT
ncbi:MAG: hypothetical protein GX896_01900, partial [Clostridiales bacterium]|nr:hypothetical protein [Clostridiales bacterium]